MATPEAPSEETPIAEKNDDGATIKAIVLELKFDSSMSDAEKAQHMTEWQTIRSHISTDFNGKIRKRPSGSGGEKLLAKVSDFQFDVENHIDGKYSWKRCVISSPYQWENRTTLNSELGDKMYRNWMNEIECMMRLLGLDWSPPQTLAQAYSYHRTLWEMMCLSHCPGVPSAEQKYIEVTECADVEVSLNASGPQTASVDNQPITDKPADPRCTNPSCKRPSNREHRGKHEGVPTLKRWWRSSTSGVVCGYWIRISSRLGNAPTGPHRRRDDG